MPIFAADHFKNEIIKPKGDDCLYPNICHPNNFFSNVFVMKNLQGYNFQIIDDKFSQDLSYYKDKTESYYQEYRKLFSLSVDIKVIK